MRWNPTSFPDSHMHVTFRFKQPPKCRLFSTWTHCSGLVWCFLLSQDKTSAFFLWNLACALLPTKKFLFSLSSLNPFHLTILFLKTFPWLLHFRVKQKEIISSKSAATTVSSLCTIQGHLLWPYHVLSYHLYLGLPLCCTSCETEQFAVKALRSVILNNVFSFMGYYHISLYIC